MKRNTNTVMNVNIDTANRLVEAINKVSPTLGYLDARLISMIIMDYARVSQRERCTVFDKVSQ